MKIVGLTTLALLLSSTLTMAVEEQLPRLVTVVGEAEVKVVPDEVTITFGVETNNPILSVAKAENDQTVQKILDVIRQYEITGKDVQTDFINIEPRSENWPLKTDIKYFVRKSVAITLRDVTKFEALITSVLESGANYLHGVQFNTSQLRQQRDSARALAIKAAQEKAEALSAALNQEILRPYSIHESRLDWWSEYNSWWGGRGGMGSQNVTQNAGGDGIVGSSTALGQIKVTAQITASFEME